MHVTQLGRLSSDIGLEADDLHILARRGNQDNTVHVSEQPTASIDTSRNLRHSCANKNKKRYPIHRCSGDSST